MSYNNAAPRRRSPCCIWGVVLGIIVLGFFAAVGIFSYRFFKDRVEVMDVTSIPDPAPTASPEDVLPEQVAEFRRVTVSDNITTGIPNVTDVRTSGVAYGLYKDPSDHEVTVIALPTQSGETPNLGGFEKLIEKRNQQKSNNAISIRDTFSGPEPKSIITWAKPNWTFVVQSTSTLATNFVKSLSSVDGVGESGDTTTTATDQ